MKYTRIAQYTIVATCIISFLSSCVVVVHDHHRHWHHGPVVHENVIVR